MSGSLHNLLSALYLIPVALLGAVVVGCVTSLVALLGASVLRKRASRERRAAAVTPATRFVVVVPAHNEEVVLAATLEGLQAQDYPADRYEVVVVADNCTDETVAIAQNYGATVLERVNLVERGKGYALGWAFEKLLRRSDPADAFVIVDADTLVALDFLSLAAAGLERALEDGPSVALQGRYGVLNTRSGWRAALMAAAFDLYNHVKPLGRDNLGLSVGLKGNGMVFSRALLEQARWRGDSITEDIDFGLDLVCEHGLRVRYLPEARVLAQMPETAAQAESQRERWEGGRYLLLRQRALPLLMEGLRSRRLTVCDAALDLMLPPLAELVGLLLVWSALIGIGAVGHCLIAAPVWMTLAAACAGGLAIYILGGLRVAGASWLAYAALFCAPVYTAWKFALYLKRFLLRGRRQHTDQSVEWVRTERTPLVASDPRPVAPAQSASEEVAV